MILAIYGASGLGSEYYGLARAINIEKNFWDKIIFVDDNEELTGKTVIEGKVYTYNGAIEEFGKDQLQFVLALGEPETKDRVYAKIKADSCKMGKLIYPEYKIKLMNPNVGEGIVCHKGSCIIPTGVFGNNVLLQSQTILGHNVVLGDNVTISSFCFIGGDTVIGRNTYIAPHSCLRNGIHIGENCVIGMGSVVTKDIPDNSIAYGNPCEVKRTNTSHKVFSK